MGEGQSTPEGKVTAPGRSSAYQTKEDQEGRTQKTEHIREGEQRASGGKVERGKEGKEDTNSGTGKSPESKRKQRGWAREKARGSKDWELEARRIGRIRAPRSAVRLKNSRTEGNSTKARRKRGLP